MRCHLHFPPLGRLWLRLTNEDELLWRREDHCRGRADIWWLNRCCCAKLHTFTVHLFPRNRKYTKHTCWAFNIINTQVAGRRSRRRLRCSPITPSPWAKDREEEKFFVPIWIVVCNWHFMHNPPKTNAIIINWSYKLHYYTVRYLAFIGPPTLKTWLCGRDNDLTVQI